MILFYSGAFIGVYATSYLRAKQSQTWQLSDAAIIGNKVCAFCVVDQGCVNATPWLDELSKFDDPPLYESLEALQSALRKRKGVKPEV